MFPQPKPADAHRAPNVALLRAVPPEARVILDIGCGTGIRGAELKRLLPGRTVFGVESDAGAAAEAQDRLDRVFVAEAESGDVPLEPGAVDCIIFENVLEHVRDPEAVLVRYRPLLRPGGVAVCAIPNVQHHTVLADLLRGDFPYAPVGVLDANHLRFFTRASFTKLALDAGYAPSLAADVPGPVAVPSDLVTDLAPVLARLGVHANRAGRNLAAYQYVFRAVPLPEPPQTAEPVTVACCVSNEAVLRANLLASPDLAPGTPHEVLLAHGCGSAAAGLNACVGRARHPLVVAVHQDVYLPRGWFARATAGFRQAESLFGAVGVAGVFGVAGRAHDAPRVGRVVDREDLLWERPALPAVVDTLDELVLMVVKGNGVRFDPRLGFHFYGADACLEARRRGLVAVAIEAVCFHNSQTIGLPASFGPSGAAFAAKWGKELPITTPCAHLTMQPPPRR